MERSSSTRIGVCLTSLAMAVAAATLCGCPETPTGTRDPADKQPNKTSTAPEQPSVKAITLESADPKRLEAILEENRGKVVIVDFWAMYCVPCLKAFPHTLELGHKFADKGLVIISVCMMEPEEDTKKEALDKLKELKADSINLISSLGGEEAAFEAFDIVPLPTYKIYGRDGKLARIFNNLDVDHPFDHTDVEAEVKKQLGL